PEVRTSLTDIRNLPIDLPGGGHILLSDVADVLLRPTPNAIGRESNTRKIEVGANVSGRALGAVVGDIEDRLEQIEFPLGYSYDLIGELAERRGAGRGRAGGGVDARGRGGGGGALCLSPPCRWPWWAACWPPTCSAAGSSPSARWSASSPCWASSPATASCSSPTASTWSGRRGSPSGRGGCCARPRSGWPRS